MSLRASYLLATSFAIVACSSVPAPQTHPPETSQISEANQSKLPRGVWEGDVSWNFFPDPEKVGLPSYHMIYRNCQDGPEILALLPDGQYASIAHTFSWIHMKVRTYFDHSVNKEEPSWAGSKAKCGLSLKSMNRGLC